jgi:hypothetical protein
LKLERQSIERNDFPAAPDGYDRAAVDSHLRAIADAVEELRQRGGPRAGAAADPAALEPEMAYRGGAPEDVFGGVDRSLRGMFGGRLEVPRGDFEPVNTPPPAPIDDLAYENAAAEDQFGAEDRSLKRRDDNK